MMLRGRWRSWRAPPPPSSPDKLSGWTEVCSLTRFGHIRSFDDSDRSGPLDGRGLFADIVELEPAEWTPVQIAAHEFLQIAERILVHRVDVIDAAQLFHAKRAAAGAAALAAEQEQKPLVADFAAAALPALQDGMVDKLLADRTLGPYQLPAPTSTLPHSRRNIQRCQSRATRVTIKLAFSYQLSAISPKRSTPAPWP